MNYFKRIQKRVNDYRESKHLSDDPLVADLQKALELDRVLENLDERILYSKDESVFEGGIAGPVCFPITTSEVQTIMKIAEKHDRHVIPRGAGSGLAGGAIPTRSSNCHSHDKNE